MEVIKIKISHLVFVISQLFKNTTNLSLLRARFAPGNSSNLAWRTTNKDLNFVLQLSRSDMLLDDICINKPRRTCVKRKNWFVQRERVSKFVECTTS